MYQTNTKYRTRVTLAATILVLSLAGLTSATSMVAVQDHFHDDHRATPQVLFSPAFEGNGGGNPETTARAYLEANRGLFQLSESAQDLELWRTRQSLTATHYRFRQLIHGIQVDKAEIIVSIDHDGRIAKVYNNTYPVIDTPEQPENLLAVETVLDTAWNNLRVHGELLEAAPSARLVWNPRGVGFNLEYRTLIGIEAPFGRWEHRIDAQSGAILGVRRTEISRKPYGKADFESYNGPVENRADATARFEARIADQQPATESSRATGSGLVFDPDPRTTLADDSLVDGSAASTFDPAYFTRTLLGIGESGGTYNLNGEYVTIQDFESPSTPPSTTPDGNWVAVRGNNAFNDAMTYFHLDQNQRYMQSLGFTGATGIQEGPIPVDSDGVGGSDNSHYIPSTNQLAFGHGCVDDNEDADVILHEYMHAITHDINPSWGGGHSGAIGEGMGDYWGGSYSYSTPNGPTYHPEWAFSWDGQIACWPGRDMDDFSQMYDPSCSYGAHTSCNGQEADQLWSTTTFTSLVDLIALGRTREEVDQIILEAQFGMGGGITQPSLASSVVAAAQALFPGGPHANVFQTNFAAQDVLDLPAIAAPVITYPAGGEVVDAGTAINITWDPNGAPADAVYTVEYTDQCTAQVMFFDDMESGDSNWAVSHGVGSNDWSLGTTNPHSGSNAWRALDPAVLSDQYLTTAAPITISGGAELSFWHDYDTESTYDGGVVEISTNGGSTWGDLGSLATTNGYSGTISTQYNSPIAGREAFTGNSSTYVETTVNMDSYAGSDVLLRFRMASDTSVSGNAWALDDVTIAMTGAWTTIGTSAPGATSMPWTTPASEGTDYCIRISGVASGHTGATTLGNAFTIGGSSIIFVDGFETDDTSMWSSVVN